eukprot:gene34446-35342_t
MSRPSQTTNGAGKGRRRRKKPFGYDVVMSVPKSFVAISLATLWFIHWWQARRVEQIAAEEASLTPLRAAYRDAMLRTGYSVSVLANVHDQWGCDAVTARKRVKRIHFLHVVVRSAAARQGLEVEELLDVMTPPPQATSPTSPPPGPGFFQKADSPVKSPELKRFFSMAHTSREAAAGSSPPSAARRQQTNPHAAAGRMPPGQQSHK